jgi:hypothetical protein
MQLEVTQAAKEHIIKLGTTWRMAPARSDA